MFAFFACLDMHTYWLVEHSALWGTQGLTVKVASGVVGLGMVVVGMEGVGLMARGV